MAMGVGNQVILSVNPLFDKDKDKILDERDLIPIHNGLFWRILLTVVLALGVAYFNLGERRREKEEAKRKYLELKNELEEVKD